RRHGSSRAVSTPRGRSPSGARGLALRSSTIPRRRTSAELALRRSRRVAGSDLAIGTGDGDSFRPYDLAASRLFWDPSAPRFRPLGVDADRPDPRLRMTLQPPRTPALSPVSPTRALRS